jgi:hypothetical protein
MMRAMRRARLSAGALVVALVLTGCGAASEDYEIAGIDQLVIPTPSPDPQDFVGYVDNQWFPLDQGSTWTYAVNVDGGAGETTMTVEPSNLALAGVAVTVLRSETVVGTDPAVVTTDYFAQDRDGNVWWFGRAGVWDVTVAGAEAGLVMPADPRVGDGWRLALLDGVVEDRATVESIEDGQVILRVESELTPGVVVQRSYDDEVGLVRTFNVEGPTGSSELTSGP